MLDGVANRTGEPLPHRVTFTVTDLVKKVNGVTSRVVWDVDVNEGVVAESELAFFAEDNAGNVWNTGEYPEEFGFDESGEYGFLGAPSTWVAGQKGATAGVHMPGAPQLGGSYQQGFAPNIKFLDCAEIVDTNATLPGYQNVLVTHETSPMDRDGAVQVKSHAPGVGIVSIGALDDPEGETLELVAVNRLDRVAADGGPRGGAGARRPRATRTARSTARRPPRSCSPDRGAVDGLLLVLGRDTRANRGPAAGARRARDHAAARSWAPAALRSAPILGISPGTETAITGRSPQFLHPPAAGAAAVVLRMASSFGLVPAPLTRTSCALPGPRRIGRRRAPTCSSAHHSSDHWHLRAA